jgi:serine-type D-Ala-D-Ala carboxypeptidase/endopeptidase (penicillin-binding protein 4)
MGIANRGFGKGEEKGVRRRALFFMLSLILTSGMGAGPVRAQTSRTPQKAAQQKRKIKQLTPTEKFAQRASAALDVAPVNKGEWGLLIEDAATGEVLFEMNGDKYFIPASNMKLLTTALALDTLGVDYRFHTTIETGGSLGLDGVLSGDLVLVGRGDPNLSNRKFPFDTKEEFDGPPERVLAELADAVVKRGVKEITGDVVGDDSYFPRERYPDGWEIGDMVWEYGAAISAIVVNDNTTTVILTPGETAGAPVSATVEPATADFIVKNQVTTYESREKADLRLTREPGSGLVVVSGTLPANSTPRKLVVAIQEPAEHAANMLARLLSERGVTVHGKIRARHEPVAQEGTRAIVAEHVSVRLGDTVKLVNKISQNLHAEMLLRTAARQRGLWATPEDLMKFPEEFYAKAGIASGDVTQADGSGLSRHDLVTPRAFAALLQYAEKQTWFEEYFASLPVAGADGTLNERMRNTAMAGRIHAKTGSVTHVRALTGFADTPSGRRLIFSFLTNNEDGKNHEVHNAMDALCLAMVEEFDVKKEVVTEKSKAK